MFEKNTVLNKLTDMIDHVRFNGNSDAQEELKRISKVLKELSCAADSFSNDETESGERFVQLAYFEMNAIDTSDM